MPDLKVPKTMPGAKLPEVEPTETMPDVKLPETVQGKPQIGTANKQSVNPHFTIAIDLDGHDTIYLAPSHAIADDLSSESPPLQKATSVSESNEPISSMNPQPIPELAATNADHQPDKPDDKDTAIQKWKSKDWDSDRFDSDDERMSLVVMMDLAHQTALLREHLAMYRQFNIRLGGT